MRDAWFALCRGARKFGGIFAFGLAVLTVGPAEAATSTDLCIRGQGAGASLVSAAEVERVTAEVERLLASRDADQADMAVARLRLTEPPGAEPASPAVLAAYCAAAGEAMRVSRSGGQGLAQEFLLAAIEYSEQATDRRISHLAAYRLALASVSVPASGNLRAARSAFRSANLVVPSSSGGTASLDACTRLLEPNYLEQASWRGALTALECASARARAARDFEISALAQHRIARLNLTAAERNPTAAAELRDAAGAAALDGVADAMHVQHAPLRREIMGLLVEAAIDGGRVSDPGMRRALEMLQSITDGAPSGRAMLAAMEGRVALARGRTADAASLLRQAIFFEGQTGRPLRMADWYLLLGEADPASRDAHVLQAYRSLEVIRPLLPPMDPLTEESNFALRMRPVFEAAVEVQLRGGAIGEEAARIASAQSIIETFRQAEIQSAFGSDCVPPGAVIEPGDLQAGEILLYPILMRDRVELIFAHRSADGAAPRYQRITGARTGRDAIARLVSDMTFSVAYGEDDSWRTAARELYDLLIAPIENLLGPDSNLVIIPDGPLRALPFAALIDAEGQFLIQRTQFSLAPALAYAQPGTRHTRTPFTVAASVEQDVQLTAGFFPALTGAKQEARAAAGVEGGDPRTGVLIEDFRRDDLSRVLARGNADILHLATHAAFNGRSDRSFIVAAGEAIPMGELRALIERGRARGDRLDLIILSACETAVGDDQASMGLAGATVQAGASSAIASLWRVSDAGTAELMRQFYSFYRAGQGRSQALRSAQLAMIGQSGDLADPANWSAFALLGSWR